jgi:hypothetical protein
MAQEPATKDPTKPLDTDPTAQANQRRAQQGGIEARHGGGGAMTSVAGMAANAQASAAQGGQEPSAGGSGGAQDPSGLVVPDPSTVGYSPNGTLLWAPTGGPLNPRKEDLDYAMQQAQEMSGGAPQQPAQEPQQEAPGPLQQKAMAELEKAAEEYAGSWADFHTGLIPGGVVGAEQQWLTSLDGPNGALQGFGYDYVKGTGLAEQIGRQAQIDLQDWLEANKISLTNVPRESAQLFQEVSGGQSAVPIYRIPDELVQQIQTGQSEDGNPLIGLRREHLYQLAPPPKGAKPYTDYPAIEVVKDQYGWLPKDMAAGMTNLDRRSRMMLSGYDEERAVDALGTNKVGTFFDSLANTATMGVVGSKYRFRHERQLETVATKGEKRSEIAGTLTGFVTPGGAAGGAFKGGRTLARVGYQALLRATAKEAIEGAGEKAAKGFGRKLAESRLANFIVGAEGAVAGGMAYEAFRPQTGIEDFYARQYADALSNEKGIPYEDALAEANSEMAVERLKGSAMMFHMVEYTSPVAGVFGAMVGRVVGKSQTTAGNLGRRMIGKAASTDKELFLRDAARARTEFVAGKAAAGALLGTELAAIDPMAREAFGKWVTSGFQDEDAWDTLVDSWVIGSSVFALHGALEGAVGWHRMMRERYETDIEDFKILGEAYLGSGKSDLDMAVEMAERERTLHRKLFAFESELASKVQGIENIAEITRAHELDLRVRQAEVEARLQEEIDALHRIGQNERQDQLAGGPARRAKLSETLAAKPEVDALERISEYDETAGRVASLTRQIIQGRKRIENFWVAVTEFVGKAGWARQADAIIGMSNEAVLNETRDIATKYNKLIAESRDPKKQEEFARQRDEAIRAVQGSFAEERGVEAEDLLWHYEKGFGPQAVTAREEAILREIAQKYGFTPYEILDYLTSPGSPTVPKGLLPEPLKRDQKTGAILLPERMPREEAKPEEAKPNEEKPPEEPPPTEPGAPGEPPGKPDAPGAGGAPEAQAEPRSAEPAKSEAKPEEATSIEEHAPAAAEPARPISVRVPQSILADEVVRSDERTNEILDRAKKGKVDLTEEEAKYLAQKGYVMRDEAKDPANKRRNKQNLDWQKRIKEALGEKEEPKAAAGEVTDYDKGVKAARANTPPPKDASEEFKKGHSEEMKAQMDNLTGKTPAKPAAPKDEPFEPRSLMEEQASEPVVIWQKVGDRWLIERSQGAGYVRDSMKLPHQEGKESKGQFKYAWFRKGLDPNTLPKPEAKAAEEPVKIEPLKEKSGVGASFKAEKADPLVKAEEAKKPEEEDISPEGHLKYRGGRVKEMPELDLASAPRSAKRVVAGGSYEIVDYSPEFERVLGRKLTAHEMSAATVEHGPKDSKFKPRIGVADIPELGTDFLRAFSNLGIKAGFGRNAPNEARQIVARRTGVWEIPADADLPAATRSIPPGGKATPEQIVDAMAEGASKVVDARFATMGVAVDAAEGTIMSTDGRAAFILQNDAAAKAYFRAHPPKAKVNRVVYEKDKDAPGGYRESMGDFPKVENVIPEASKMKDPATISLNQTMLLSLERKILDANRSTENAGVRAGPQMLFGTPALGKVLAVLNRLGSTSATITMDKDRPAWVVLIQASTPHGKLRAALMPLSPLGGDGKVASSMRTLRGRLEAYKEHLAATAKYEKEGQAKHGKYFEERLQEKRRGGPMVVVETKELSGREYRVEDLPVIEPAASKEVVEATAAITHPVPEREQVEVEIVQYTGDRGMYPPGSEYQYMNSLQKAVNSERKRLDAEGFDPTEFEIAGLLGETPSGEVKAITLARGDASSVRMGLGQLKEQAAAAGMARIVGVFHTHPKGEEVGRADMAAAQMLHENYGGLRLFVQRGARLETVVRSGEKRGHVEHLEQAIGKLKDQMKNGPASPDLEVKLYAYEAALGKAKKGNPFKDKADADKAADEAHIGQLFLEASQVSKIGGVTSKLRQLLAGPGTSRFRTIMGSLLEPDPAIARGAFAGRTIHTPTAVLGKFRDARNYVPVELYDFVRSEDHENLKMLDKLQRVLHGRSLEQRIRYGGEGGAKAPLTKIKKGSASSARISAALDGWTVADWNPAVEGGKKHGALKAAATTDMRDLLTPVEREVYDAADSVLKAFRARMWAHINRFRLPRYQERQGVLSGEVESMSTGRSAYEASLHAMPAGLKAHTLAKYDARLETLRTELAEVELGLQRMKDFQDPVTGNAWGHERYFHHIFEEDGTGKGHEKMSAIGMKHIPRERWAASFLSRRGREGYLLDLHRMFDVYVPEVLSKISLDKTLAKQNEIVYGVRRRAFGVRDLAASWHITSQNQSRSTALQWISKDGSDIQHYGAMPHSAIRSATGEIVGIKVKDLSTEIVETVWESRQAATAHGDPHGKLAREFRYLSGGIATTYTNPRKAHAQMEYIEKWIGRVLGRRPHYGAVGEAMRKLARAITGFEYHMYLGVMYPKAASTNLIFGTTQLVSEIGPIAAARGMEAAMSIVMHGRGKSTQESRDNWKILREGGAHLESFIGYDARGLRGLDPHGGPVERTYDSLNKTSFVLFRNSEKLIRAASYLAGYHLAHDKGWSREESHKFAREIVANTQFDMAAYAAPAIVDHPLGFLWVMLRRYAIGLAERNIRGLAGLTHVAHSGAVSTIGRNWSVGAAEVIDNLTGSKRSDKERIADFRRKEAKGFKDEHLYNAAYTVRNAIVTGLALYLYKEITGRDAKNQLGSTAEDLPVVGDVMKRFNDAPAADVINFISGQTLRGVTGPFDLLTPGSKAIVGLSKAFFDRSMGDRQAMVKLFESNPEMYLSRTVQGIMRLVNAEAAAGGDLRVMESGKGLYESTMKELILDMVLPGTPIDREAMWHDMSVTSAKSQERKYQREEVRRLIASDDIKDIEKALDLMEKEGILVDVKEVLEASQVKKFTAPVRKILTGVDKTDRVAIVAEMMPHYSDQELLEALSLIGANEPGWYQDRNGTLTVAPAVMEDFVKALEERMKTFGEKKD